MSSKIAHDLDNNKWRSEDITISLEDNEREENEMTFDSLNLKPNVLMGLKACGFARPSPIQLNCIPLGRCGLDLIVQSKSGTGKTCVFVVIALEIIQSIESNATQVLIIGPTREIAVQIAEVVNGLSSKTPNFKCCTAIGGVQLKQDRDQLKKSQVVVGTPGRIKQLIELNLLKTNSIRLLVLDECDKLLDNNFKQQIDGIYESLPQNKQMIVCSATMTTDLAQFLSKYMRTPAFVRLNADNPALIGVTQYLTITDYHHLNHINFDNKIEPLIEIMRKIPFSQCLVFSNYQTRYSTIFSIINYLLSQIQFI
jgi:ATP-dependent RNA helicase DDX20